MLRFLLITFLLSPFLSAAQSPWSRSKAGFYAQAAWQFIPSYSTLYGTGDGEDYILPRSVSENNLQLYGEYGITKSTTVTAALPFVFNRRGCLNPESPLVFELIDSGSVAGLGNVNLAVRHQFLAGKVALAGTLRVGLPTAKHQSTTGLRTGYDALTVVPTASVGMGFGKAYWFAYAGYGYRSNDYSHFANAGVEGGYRVWKIWLIGFSELVAPLDNGSRTVPPFDVLTGLYVNHQGWLSVGMKSIFEANRFWGLNFSAAGAAWGETVPKRPAFSVGAYFKWD